MTRASGSAKCGTSPGRSAILRPMSRATRQRKVFSRSTSRRARRICAHTHSGSPGALHHARGQRCVADGGEQPFHPARTDALAAAGK